MVLGFVGVIGVLLGNELLSRAGVISESVFPSTGELVSQVSDLLMQLETYTALGGTMRAWTLGIIWGTLIGCALGMLLGASPLAHAALLPLLDVLRPIPPIVVLPLFILIYGTSLQMQTILAAVTVVWQMLFQTLYGVRAIDPLMEETARAYRMGWWRRHRHIVIPSVLPWTITGLRIAASNLLGLVVIVEMASGIPGAGREILMAQNAGATGRMYAWIVILGLLGVGINALLSLLERWLLRWRTAATRVAVAR